MSYIFENVLYYFIFEPYSSQNVLVDVCKKKAMTVVIVS